MEHSSTITQLSGTVLASVPDTLDIGIAVVDERGILVHVNPTCARLLGYRPDELAGRCFTTVLPPPDAAGALAAHRSLIAGIAPAGHPTDRRHVARDGRTFDLLATDRRLVSPDGHVYRVVSLLDVTDRRRREREMEAARARFESYFVHSPDNIFVVLADADGRLVYEAHNPASERATGIANAEIAGRSPEEVWPPDAAERIVAQYRQVMETGQPLQVQHEMSLGGTLHVWDTVLMPVRDAVGRITRIQGRSRDVTEEVRSRQRLKEAQDLLALIYDAADVGISVTDKDCRLVAVNRAYANFVSDDPGSLIGRKVTDLVPPETRAEVERWHRSVMSGGRIHGATLHGVNPRGEPIVYSVSSSLFRDAGGNSLSVTVLTDVTRLKQLEQNLTDREERLRHIADSMPALIGLTDRDARLVFVNQAFCDWFATTRDRLVGARLSEIVTKATYEHIAGHVERALGGEDVAFAAKDNFPDGVRRTLRVSLIPHRTEGRPDGTYIFAFDVSSIVDAQEALVLAKETAEAANRAKTQFLANMSHELRTPLNAIIGFSDMMASAAFGPLGHRNYQAYVGDILESGRHLLGLINSILDLAKVEAGRYELRDEEVDLAKVAEEAVTFVRLRAERAGITLDCLIGPETPSLRADRRATMQMLLNLLSNGVKFTPAGGRVTLSARPVPGGLAVEVADTGIGIPESKLAEIAKPFVQIDNVLTRSHEGTGIGLYLTKMLMELHGGRLELASAVDKGTTASLVFPADRLSSATAPPTTS